MDQLITTAVIPAGGWGTRFLPATKSIPKEMFPMGNKPIIMHVVEECVNSGIKSIIFIVSHHKQSIESFFSANVILENYFKELGKTDQVEQLQKIFQMAEFSFVYTKPPYGNGGCLVSARHLLEGKPFVLVWSDELILTRGMPRVKQCMQTYEKFARPVISAVKIPDPAKRSAYGMAELRELQDIPDSEKATVKEIVRIVEKPPLGSEPSEFATHGAYILPPNIFTYLDRTSPGKNGDLWLTDIINNMLPETGLLAKIIEDSIYLDCGNPRDYLLSQIDFALEYTDYSKDIENFLVNRAAGRVSTPE